ncbi:type II/IV secretion system ATPase subunit [archaeon]|jgi:archaeal flagellar protein FlaI|nr:type II/IV secretion system ATPase subunit [archaeon]MBT3577827.1 type II/IV secretion system ATPase subunit [archaeon]MBT6820178.1 type II/IV secretion system ATPase subunit [archaeon]MBT6955791.1 type II/IV secretion system ATPase subunit [archaeon]MBT7025289.1 type II/IV secretion system ATPase subunit [archaeon]
MGDININLSPRVPAIPRFNDKTKIDVRYMVISPFVSIHVAWDEKVGELIYNVEEPILSEEDKGNLKRIEQAMREVVNVNFVGAQGEEKLIDYVDKTARLVISELGMKIEEEIFKKIFFFLYRDFIGLNEIEAMMRDYFIEDIECNGVGEPIYIVHRVFRNVKTNIKFDSVEKLANFVEKLAQKTGRYISYASPMLDGSLPDGSRVNATYTKDISSKGPTFTIRKFTKVPWTPTQLIGFNTLSPEMLAYFWMLLEYKSNIMIVGGTASGKTTLLNAIAFFIPPEARVVSIEDTRELNLPRENWLPSVVRTGVSSAGVGEVDMFTLLKGSFRQNPDYVIVGEVRGKEAAVLFQGMASGHASISTIHADSVDTLIRRLETPPISLNPALVNGLDAVAIMTHAIVKKHETRRLREIVEIVNVQQDGTAMTNTPFSWNPADDQFYFKKNSKIVEKISGRFGLTVEELQKELETRTKLIYALFQRKVFGYEEVQRTVNEYHRNPAAVLQKFGVV